METPNRRRTLTLLIAMITSLVPVTSQADSEIVIFVAQKIVTMEPGQPMATAVAVQDGLIVDVGSLARSGVRPSRIRDIEIWGTVFEGEVFKSP